MDKFTLGFFCGGLIGLTILGMKLESDKSRTSEYAEEAYIYSEEEACK
jgi:hypothetical protein